MAAGGMFIPGIALSPPGWPRGGSHVSKPSFNDCASGRRFHASTIGDKAWQEEASFENSLEDIVRGPLDIAAKPIADRPGPRQRAVRCGWTSTILRDLSTKHAVQFGLPTGFFVATANPMLLSYYENFL